jgi:hypothetical protein
LLTDRRWFEPLEEITGLANWKVTIARLLCRPYILFLLQDLLEGFQVLHAALLTDRRWFEPLEEIAGMVSWKVTIARLLCRPYLPFLLQDLVEGFQVLHAFGEGANIFDWIEIFPIFKEVFVTASLNSHG